MLPYPVQHKIDRTPKTPEAAKNLLESQQENWALFILKGMQGKIALGFLAPFISAKTRDDIAKLLEKAIQEIKEVQQIRRITRKVRRGK